MKTTFIILTAWVLAGLLAMPASVHAQANDPSTLVRAWVDALNAHDYDAALSLVDEEAFLIFQQAPDSQVINTYAGRAQIRQALQAFGSDNTRIKLVGEPFVEHGTLGWIEEQSSDSLRGLGIASVRVIGNALVEAGKFKSILYELTRESAARLGEAMSSGGGTVGETSTYVSEIFGVSSQPHTGSSSTEMPGTGGGPLSSYLLIVLCLALLLTGLSLRLSAASIGTFLPRK